MIEKCTCKNQKKLWVLGLCNKQFAVCSNCNLIVVQSMELEYNQVDTSLADQGDQ